MNLELIKKYEKEFLHMLHGGKVLMGKKDLVTNTIKWYPSVLNPFVETSNTIVVVIDDIYCTYRKALAEGKQLQLQVNLAYQYTGTFGCLDNNGCYWQDYTTGNFILQPHCYRIKPEEPELKVGDYVRYIHANSPKPLQISNINCEKYYFENAEIILRVDEIEKWEPKEDEICLFWDGDYNGAIISKFSHMEQEKYGTDLYTWNNCMPFTGILPPHMKDSK